MLRKITASLVATAALALPSLAGDCTSSLDVAVDGDIQSGATVSVDVSGSLPMAITFLAVGETPGETSFALGPLGDLTIGLDFPFAVLPVGQTDLAGDLSVSFETPGAPVEIEPLSLHAQAITLGLDFGGFPPELSLCTSNLTSFSIQ